jgi:hypothetical protein
MLVNYARSVGLPISGLKTYEEHLAGAIQTVNAAFTHAISKAMAKTLPLATPSSTKKGK